MSLSRKPVIGHGDLSVTLLLRKQSGLRTHGIVVDVQIMLCWLQVHEEEEGCQGGGDHEAHPEGHDAQRGLPLL